MPNWWLPMGCRTSCSTTANASVPAHNSSHYSTQRCWPAPTKLPNRSHSRRQHRWPLRRNCSHASKPRLWLYRLHCTFREGVLQTGVVPRYFVRLVRCTVSACGFAENLSKLSPIVINQLPMKLLLRVDLSNNSLDLSMSSWIFRWAGEKFELTAELTPIIGVTR